MLIIDPVVKLSFRTYSYQNIQLPFIVWDEHSMGFLLPADQNFLGNTFHYSKVKALF